MVTIEEGNGALDSTAGGNGVAPAPGPAQATTKVDVDPATAALVTRWIKDIKAAKDSDRTKKAFDRMRKCMKIAADGTDKEAWLAADKFVVPIINRFVNQAVASLYAKNPKAVAKRKQKMMFQLWDGDPQSIMAAMQKVQQPAMVPVTDPMTGQPVADPHTGQPVLQPQVDAQAVALLTELQQVKQQNLLYDRMAETLQLLFSYYLQEQDAGYKEQFKAMVRRAKVCAVAYVELDFQRALKRNEDTAARIADATSQIAAIEAGVQLMQDGQTDAQSAEAAELKLLIDELQSQVEIIVREGPVLAFPRATEVIVDPKCRHLKTFSGARWIAREFDMDAEDVLETYGVNLGKNYTSYVDGQAKAADGKEAGCCRVWRVQDKKNQQQFVVCDGYPDFLEAPHEPNVKIERFWTIFPLVFNEIESEDQIYPPSDVWGSRHMQQEYNNSRQGLREHRRAARPRWVTPKGKLDASDKAALGESEAFQVIELNSLVAKEKITDVLQAAPTPGVDPNLYEVETIFNDIMRSVGAQEANFGGTSDTTATQTSVAEESRASTTASDVDDLDSMLSALARAMGQLMFLELSKETVVEIAGPGAVWPDLPPRREEIVKELLLDIEAGSSGRPNRAAELANLERAMPWIQILPGINPVPIAKKALDLIDVDIEEAIVEGLPSIQAMNTQAGHPPMQPGAGGKDDPTQQGAKGAQNAENPRQDQPGPQPAFPAPNAAPHPG